MTRNSQRPRSTRGKALIAMFAATAALAGGVQALAPAPAAAVMDDNTGDCTDVGWTDWSAFCEDDNSGGGGGLGSSSGGGQPTGTVTVEPEPQGQQESLGPEPTRTEEAAQDFQSREPEPSVFKNTKELIVACQDLSWKVNADLRDLSDFRDQIDDEQSGGNVNRGRLRKLFGESRLARSAIKFNRKQYRAWDCDSTLPTGDY